MSNLRKILLQGLLAYTAIAGVLAIFFLDYSWLPGGGPLPYALSYIFPSIMKIHISLAMAITSLVLSEGVLHFFYRPLQENGWVVFFCLTWMGAAWIYLSFINDLGMVSLNAFLVFSIYLIRFQQRFSSRGVLFQCLLALVFLWPSIIILIDAGNDERYGILCGKADEMTTGVCVFLAPFFFILPALFPYPKNRYVFIGCGLAIFLVIAAMTNPGMVYFLITGNAKYLKEIIQFPYISILAALGLSCIVCLYALLVVGLGELGYWLVPRVAPRLSQGTNSL